MTPRTTIELRIKRQDTPTSAPRWEEFSLPYRPNMNVISCLMEIRKRPVTKQGSRTSPIAWDAACLEEVCGSCTMLVNGRRFERDWLIAFGLVDLILVGLIVLAVRKLRRVSPDARPGREPDFVRAQADSGSRLMPLMTLIAGLAAIPFASYSMRNGRFSPILNPCS